MQTATAPRHDHHPDDATLVCVGLPMVKARPVTEGDRRLLYLEASRETFDDQAEKILKSALLGSADLFLAKGNIDLDHKSMPQVARVLGIENPREWEIGLPLEVRELGDSVFVKGEIYRGNRWADWFWETFAEQSPAMRWFPSIGGLPLERRTVVDGQTGQSRRIVVKARWSNLALSREPIHPEVAAASIQPFGAFVKSVQYALEHGTVCTCDDAGCSCTTAKAVTAGYGTDAAGLTGGAALRVQSLGGGVLDQTQGWRGRSARFLNMLAGCEDRCAHARGPVTHTALTDHFCACEGLSEPEARQEATRLLTHVTSRLRRAKEDRP